MGHFGTVGTGQTSPPGDSFATEGSALTGRNLSNLFKSNKIINFLSVGDFVKNLFDFCAVGALLSATKGVALTREKSFKSIQNLTKLCFR